MTELGDLLIARIRASQPITIADYMAECLTHPTLGYYTNRDPLGSGGDFTTAPEISQMFGELIGLCLAECWLNQGAPEDAVLLELGPGRGTLMSDILRAAGKVAGFADAMSVHLLEVSEPLRARQALALGATTPKWIDDLTDLSKDSRPVFFVANEFFDALPIRQFERTNTAWRERVIGVDDGRLTFGLAPENAATQMSDRLADTKSGDLVELNAAANAISTTLGQWVAERGGGGLIIDYGGWRSFGDTLQALADHKPCPVLEAPGKADLTTHVDFEAVSRAAEAPGARVTQMTTQGIFLERLGITQRAQNLATGLAGSDLDSHIAAHRRLTHPEEMGELFKVIGIYPENTPPLAGLDA